MESSQSLLIRGMITLGVGDRKITAGSLNMTCTGRETQGKGRGIKKYLGAENHGTKLHVTGWGRKKGKMTPGSGLGI